MVKPNVCCHIMSCFPVLIGTAAAIVCGVLAFVGVVVMVLIVVKKKLRQIYGTYKVKQYEVTH